MMTYMASHYVCGECAGVSKSPGICENESCALQGVALTECRCVDGLHRSVVQNKAQKADELEIDDSPTTTLDLDSGNFNN